MIQRTYDADGRLVDENEAPSAPEAVARDRLREGIIQAVERLSAIELADPTKVTARQVVDAVQDLAGILRHAIVLSIAPDLLGDDDATA